MTNPVILKLRQASSLTAADETVILDALNVSTHDAACEDLVREGDAPDGLLLVLEGFAYRYKVVRGGGRQIVAVLVAGDFCDVHAALLREMDHSIATLGPCTLATVPRPAVQRWMDDSVGVRRAVEWATLVDEAILREWLVNLGARDAYVRTAHLFCELQARLEAVGVDVDGAFPLPMTQEALSHTLGLSVVHMNRVLGRLRTEGLAVFRRGAVSIPDRERLVAVADFRPNYLHQTPRAA